MKHRKLLSLLQGKQGRNKFCSCERFEGRNRDGKPESDFQTKKFFENNAVSDFLPSLGNAISISKNFLFTP